MKNYFRSIAVIVGSIIVYFSGRILLSDNINSVRQFEAILFFIVSVLFFYFLNWEKNPIRKVQRLEIVLCYFYLLGSLRAALMIFGTLVNHANLVLFILSIVIIFYHLIIRKSINGNKRTTSN
jgi:preprotein translocase subunit YajC